MVSPKVTPGDRPAEQADAAMSFGGWMRELPSFIRSVGDTVKGTPAGVKIPRPPLWQPADLFFLAVEGQGQFLELQERRALPGWVNQNTPDPLQVYVRRALPVREDEEAKPLPIIEQGVAQMWAIDSAKAFKWQVITLAERKANDLPGGPCPLCNLRPVTTDKHCCWLCQSTFFPEEK